MNSTIDDRITDGQNLDEPHFDEEATILAARPVVPLDEVKTEGRSKAGAVLALAIGGGLLIGLLAATLIYRYLDANQVPQRETTTVAEQPASQVGEQMVNPLPSPAGGAVVDDSSVRSIDDSAVTIVEDAKPADDTETREPEPEVEERKPVKTQDRAPDVEPRQPIVVRESTPPADEEKGDEAARGVRRAARQEERRERRAVRETRRQERQSNQTADDLTRIREIFEGAPKP